MIDEIVGAPCITYSAIGGFSNLDSAIENLRVREGMPRGRGVGFTAPSFGKESATAVERHRQAVKTGFGAAIWTALGNNFEEKTSEPFSVKAAIRYLEARNERTLDAALRYIGQAPPEIKTPVREAVNARWPAHNPGAGQVVSC